MKILSWSLAALLVSGCFSPAETNTTYPGFPAPPPTAPPPVQPPKTSGFMSIDAIEDTILLDLQALSTDEDRENARYLVGCDRSNSEEELTEFGAGVNKGINMLSQSRFIANAVPVGRTPCIFRIDLQEYDNLTRGKWRKIEKHLLLDFVSGTVRNQNIQFLTQTLKPYVWADDFFTTTFESDALAEQDCNLYCDLLDLPKERNAFFASQGINVQREYDLERVLLGGTGNSPITIGKSRLIEIFESDNGYCMTSLDTDLQDEDSIFQNSFTVEASIAQGVRRTNKVFTDLARETICFLPNGLPLWRLEGADGIAATSAPASVVQNVGNGSIDQQIRVGDCTGCHKSSELAKQFTDEVSNHIKRNSAYNAEEKILGKVFFDPVKLAATMNRISALTEDTLQEIGEDGNTDTFTRRLTFPFRSRYDAVKAAGKAGMEVPEFLEALSGTAISSQVLGNILSGGTVSAGTYIENYETLVEELNLFQDDDL